MIASCGFLEDELRQCSKEEGVTMADSVGGRENKNREVGSQRKSEEEEVQGEILAWRSRSCDERIWFQRGPAQRRSGSGKEVLLRITESQWNRGHPRTKKWESEKHKNWGMPAEAFEGHVATDGSLLGTTGKWRACGWLVV